MVTCPWCGTNYLEFQSNCKNCGGPLNRPVEQADMEAGESLPTPPPPPRSISDSYAWRLMMSDGWAITAGVFALMGVIFAPLGIVLTVGIVTAFVGIPFVIIGLAFLGAGGGILYWRYQEMHRTVEVLRDGVATRGQILEAQENLAVMVNNRHPWTISYHFELNGEERQGKVSTLNTPGPQLQPGKVACVLYLPNAPDKHMLYPHP
jgi:hypothetical protein